MSNRLLHNCSKMVKCFFFFPYLSDCQYPDIAEPLCPPNLGKWLVSWSQAVFSTEKRFQGATFPC